MAFSHANVEQGLGWRPGDTVLVVAPCGPIPEEPFWKGIDILRGWDLNVCFAEGLWAKDRYLAGSDENRLRALMQPFESKKVSGVWMARGGYGMSRLQRIWPHNWTPSMRPPVIGFSDGTALHAVLDRAGVSSVHGPVITQLFRLSPESLAACYQFLFGNASSIRFPEMACLNGNPAPITGKLWGGNLAVLAGMLGTPFHRSWKDKLIFLEDVGESAYRVDRMIHQFLLAGELDRAAGVLIGDFSGSSEEDTALRETLWSEVASWIPCPLWTGFAIGHEGTNWMVPCGGEGTVIENRLTLGGGAAADS